MSAFEVVVTPTRVKNARRKTAAREPTELVLAPFSAKSVVEFDDIPVTKTARRFLNITNPSDEDLTVTVKHSIDPIFGVTFEWATKTIPSKNTVTMEIVWTPRVEVTTRDKLRFIDDREFQKDVTLIFKSININSNNIAARPAPPPTKTTKYATGKLKIKSPSPPQGLLRHAMSNKQKVKSTVRDSIGVRKAASLQVANKLPLGEINIFNQQNKISHGKENKSPPRSPLSVTALFDEIQFTPVNNRQKNNLTVVEHQHDHDDIDYMASLPTPVLKPAHNHTYALRNPSDTMEITSFEPNIASTIGRGTTSSEPIQMTESDYRRKLFDLTGRSLCPDSLILSTSTAPVLNVTHTIVPASGLTNIKEEPSHESYTIQNNFPLSPTMSEVPSPQLTVQRSSQQGVDTLNKKFQSMRNLDDLSNEQKLLRDNLGSMPNLTDIVAVQSIESNRYFYQSIGNGLQTNEKHNQSCASSVFGGSVMSFKEHDFLAQSSRFNINESRYMDATLSNRREFAVPQPVDNHRTKRAIDDEQAKQSMKWSPPKRSKLESKSEKSETSSNNSSCSSTKSVRRSSNWAGVKPKKFPYIPKLNLTRQKEEERVVFFDPELHIKPVINPDPFAATTTNDPFLCTTMYLDDRCIEIQEMNFKKWLNALVTIPWDVDSDKQAQQIDFGKLFNDVRGKDLNMAETKEQVSSHYLTKHRMESLRKTAMALYMSENMTQMFQKLCVKIERGDLKIRDGIDLHLDVVLQREILELLLCFNPLWLRISVEVIYGEIINMSHNFDIMSLSRFIVNRLFKNKHLEQKYSRILPQKLDKLKKFSLQKLFMLLIFLDNAKQKKIVPHNPCLFLKTSKYKETKEILCKISSSILGSMGDILRDLKLMGIVLRHKQTYIEEFDYAFRNLAVDLRDGIRLTKVMEIILLRDDLLCKLRVPANSRLQKVFNVNLALNALKDAGYVISGGIVAADIADGHREKTLSLLWQIIYKFRAPKFNEAAIRIQLWWRRSWLKVIIKQRIRAKLQKARTTAATRIQAAYRAHLSRKSTKMWHAKRTSAAIILQSHIRRYLAQKSFKRQSNAVKYIQNWYARTCLYNRQRNHFLHQRDSTIRIQRWYRRIRLARRIESFVPLILSLRNEVALQNRSATIIQTRYRATGLMRLERANYLRMRSSAVVIQQRFRSFLLMKKDRAEYLRFRETVISVQRKFRAKLQSKEMKTEFQLKKNAAVSIQRYFRGFVETKRARNEFLTLKKAAHTLQVRYRARLDMLKAANEFQMMKRAAIVLQQRYRARVKMIEDSKSFQAKKEATIVLQNRYRALVEMRRQRQNYLRIQSAVQKIQLKWRATLMMRKQVEDYKRIRTAITLIQKRLVANQKMVKQRTHFAQLKEATICIQSHYRARLLMREERAKYQQLLWACKIVQQRYRANKIAKTQQETYQRLKQHAVCIKNRFRANRLMKSERQTYSNLKAATISIQRIFRGKLKMREERQKFLDLIRVTIFVQRTYRANKAMEIDSANFKQVKWSVGVIQERFRAQIQMKRQRAEFLKERSSAMKIQQWIRSVKLLKEDRQRYVSYRQAVVNIQRRYRAKLLMQEVRSDYNLKLWAVLLIQRKFRARRLMLEQRNQFQRIRNAAIVVQRRYRAKIKTIEQMAEYRGIVQSVKLIQIRFRAYKLMRMEREKFVALRTATVTIQTFIRSYQLSRSVRESFVILKRSTIFVQRLFRANLSMRADRDRYLTLRQAAISMQRIYKANVLMKAQREIYQEKRKAALTIQKFYRATQAMELERRKYLALRDATLFCQRHFRANLMMLQQRCAFLIYKTKVTFVQRQFRATIQMRVERAAFQQLKKSTISVQRRFRSNICAKNQRCEYLKLKKATVFVQQRFRTNRALRIQRMRDAAIIIQTRYRSYLVMKECRASYQRLREAAIQIQTKHRANLLMKSQRAEFNRLRSSAIIIQKWFRATMRMKNLSNQYKLIRCLVVCIQRRFRAKLAMRIERENFLRIQSAAVVLQRKYRARREMILERNALDKKRATILGLQARIRGFIARQQYRKKLSPEFKLFMKQSKCAVKIQSFWRGWIVRKRKGVEGVALKKIRAKVEKISKDVKTEKQIKNVVSNYVSVLKKSSSFDERLKVLLHLGRMSVKIETKSKNVKTEKQIESVTVLKEGWSTDEVLNVLLHLTKISRMVPHLLVNDSIFVISFCYGVMAQAIRSEMDKLVIEQCSYIILNLARYELTKANVFQLHGLTTIAQMLLRWCNKDCDIFKTLCSVVYVFCQSAELTTKIRNFMTSADSEYALREIKYLVERHENMRKNKRQHSTTLSRLNAGQTNALPMLKPDFGMKSTEPYIFNCSIFAFDTILNKLNITNI